MKALLESVLHKEIPITQAMGVSVLQASGQEVAIKASLAKNTNHKSTAFGGSLNTVAVLACWGMLYVRLHEENIHAHIVIQSSSVSYITPVTEDIIARCDIDETAYAKMLRTFKRYEKGRIKLQAKVYNGNELALEFEGEYVIHT